MMQPVLRILNLEDEPKDTELIRAKLEKDGITYEMTRVETEEDFVSAITQGGIDLVLADFKLPTFDGLSALTIAKEKCPDIPFIFVSGSIGEERAIESLKQGATDYVLKENLSRLPSSVRRAMKESEKKAERKQAEEEREKLQAQFNQAQKMESVGRLAGGVAHDFNNMLGIILGYAEIALYETRTGTPLHHNLKEIQKAARRSADITRQLLAFARKQTIAPMVLDLNSAVEGMLKMLRRLIGEDLDLVWMPGAGLWPVKMDPSQVDQILANLCVNARDAIAGVGKVTIETQNVTFDEAYCAHHVGFVPGEFALLAVSDDGCGMDKETQERLFEPFFTTKEIGKGTGLGLATVYGIVKQNDGYIDVYSETGKGAAFKIYLPRHAGRAVDTPAESAAEIPLCRGETVLLVEDEPAMLKMGKMMLEKLGYGVLVADTPGKAVRLAEAHPGDIHLLVTDVVMPEMTSRDLADRLQSLYPKLKRLFMSGYTANVIVHHGVLEQGVHFIQKPFSLQQLAVKVREAMGGAGGQCCSIKREARRGGGEKNRSI
jgi:signal transduction histidine kinase